MLAKSQIGSSKNMALPIVLGVILLAAAGFFLKGFLTGDPEPEAVTEDPADSDAASGIANVTSRSGSSAVSSNTDVESLLAEAKAARDKGQYIDPEGANEVELYLRVLELDANNRSAQDALLEVIPYAQDRVDQYISEGNIPQADRALALMRRADPNAVFLTSLAGRLETQKRLQASREAEQSAALLAQQQLAQSRAQQAQADANETTAAATPAPAVAETPAPAPTAASPRPAAATPAPTIAAATPTPSVAAQSAPEARNFQLIKKVDPSYPQRALRQRMEGWVELSFTVTVNGDVTGVEVVNAQPKREFDREAIRALQQWKFKPRIENGKAVQASARQRLEFRLGG